MDLKAPLNDLAAHPNIACFNLFWLLQYCRLCVICCRWERVRGGEPLLSCLPQRHGHLLLLLSARPHHLSWRQDLSGYITHKHSPSCHWVSAVSSIVTQTGHRLNNSALRSHRHWWVFAGWERVPRWAGLWEHYWLLPMCHALWARLPENSWWSQLHRYISELYWSAEHLLWVLPIWNFCLLSRSDVNECQESNPCNQHCLNTIGSYRCACEPGFQLRNRRCIGETFYYSW